MENPYGCKQFNYVWLNVSLRLGSESDVKVAPILATAHPIHSSHERSMLHVIAQYDRNAPVFKAEALKWSLLSASLQLERGLSLRYSSDI